MCDKHWINTHFIEKKKKIHLNDLCHRVFNNGLSNGEVKELVGYVNSGNVAAIFLLGYYSIEKDNAQGKTKEQAVNLIKTSAFRSNPYAHYYLYELYSNSKYGMLNETEARINLTLYQSYDFSKDK